MTIIYAWPRALPQGLAAPVAAIMAPVNTQSKPGVPHQTRNAHLRNLLLGTVAAGVVMMGYGRAAYAGCVTDGTTITCTGDLSAGVPAAANPTTVLNVNSLTTDIAPASGTDGINFTSTGDITIVSDTGAFGISVNGANAEGIYAKSTVAGAVSVTHTGDITSDDGGGIYSVSNDGNLTILSTGTIQAQGEGITALGSGTGNTSVTHTGDITSDNTFGLRAQSLGSVTTHSTGNIQSGGIGIDAQINYGAGAVSVTHIGDVTSTGSIGVFARSRLGSTTTESTGTIQADSDGIRAYSLNAGAVSVTHTGDITSDTRLGIYARSSGGSVTTITNGTINAQLEGIRTQGSGAGSMNVTHTGDITSVTDFGVYASSGTGSTEITLGDGVVQGAAGAIDARSGTGTTLNLNAGSVLIGTINFGGAGAAVLNTGPGLSVAHTFTGTVPTIGDVSGNIAAVSGNQIAVADISNLGAADNLLSDTLDGVFSAIEASRDRGNGNWWLSGFGGVGVSPTTSAAPQAVRGFGGVVAGTHAMLGDGMQLGVFGGVSKGTHLGNVTNGARTDTASFFGGVYGGIATEVLLLDFALSAGGANNKGTRSVANNTVATGLETALSDHNSFFIAPEFTLSSQPIEIQGVGFIPSLRVRYELLQSAGFTETGLTSGALTTGGANTHALNARLQGAIPIETGNSAQTLLARMGVDVRYAKSSGRDATLIGVTTTAAGSGEEFSGGGFAGLDFTHVISDLVTLTGNTELQFGTTGISTTASLGIKGNL